MSGQWPPEWGEPDWEDEDREGTVADSGAADEEHPEAAAVIAALSAVPMPALPDAVEARITAALAAEAAARATGPTTATEPTAAHRLDTSRPRAAHRRGRRFRPIVAIAPLVTILLIGGFGYLVTHLGGSSSSSSAVAEAPSQANGQAGPKAPDALGEKPAFVVTVTGTRYQQATLIPQLRQALAASRSSVTPSSGHATAAAPAASVPPAFSSAAASASSGNGVFTPSRTLVGCVLRVTGNVVPSLVEYATYQGKTVYVIVVPDHAWIVGVGCTATDPRVITSVSLAG